MALFITESLCVHQNRTIGRCLDCSAMSISTQSLIRSRWQHPADPPGPARYVRERFGVRFQEARVLGLPALELQSRVELGENRAAFAALGFFQVGLTSHPGFDRPTSSTFRRAVV